MTSVDRRLNDIIGRLDDRARWLFGQGRADEAHAVCDRRDRLVGERGGEDMWDCGDAAADDVTLGLSN